MTVQRRLSEIQAPKLQQERLPVDWTTQALQPDAALRRLVIASGVGAQLHLSGAHQEEAVIQPPLSRNGQGPEGGEAVPNTAPVQ